MAKIVKLRKGFDINIKGKAEMTLETLFVPENFAVKPTDFLSLSPIPKLHVKEGDMVKAGDALFYDKVNPDVLFTAPVSGEVKEIKRGERRSIAAIIIAPDKVIAYKSFTKANPNGLNREEIIETLLSSGLWPVICQRPYGLIADPKATPKSIFVSGFDTSPLAPDIDFIVHGKGDAFQAGLDALKKMTDGTVHLNLNAKIKHSEVLTKSKNVQINWFSGKHPAGNVGVQIHHIDPIKKGDIVWQVSPQDVMMIGRLFLEGKFVAERIVALAGPKVKRPKYYRVQIGASVESIIKDNVEGDNVRIISGNVLTGKKVERKGHLGYYDSLITIIEEGNHHEFLGWLFPNYSRPSFSRTFMSGWLSVFSSNKKYNVNTNMHGEERPFVMAGEYEQVLPMNIYPQQLLKSILYKDFDEMEGLGIYEVIEEDLALCEFICTSKVDVQEILREGLDLMSTEG